MSIYATNYVVDETTGEVRLIKHLNKIRVDRGHSSKSGKWGKTGKKARNKKRLQHIYNEDSRSSIRRRIKLHGEEI